MSTIALSYCFPPGRFAQSPQIARFVAGLGSDVRVVAGDDPDTDTSLEATLPPGATIERLPWTSAAMARRLARRVTLHHRWGRPDAYRPWADAAASHILDRLRPGPDDLLATFGQPMSDHVAGLGVARSSGVTWLAHFSDPWIGNPYHLVAWSAGWQARQERAVLERAAAVVVTSDETAEVLASHLPAAGARIHVVPHAHDPALYPLPGSAAEATVTVRHLGAFYGPRSPDPLFDALALLLERGEDLGGVRVELVGPTGAWSTGESLRRLPGGLVRALPAVPYLESLALMRSSSLLLVIDAPATESVFLPSKLVEYVGARRPIVALTPPGASRRVVTEVGGSAADPTDVEGCADALLAGLADVGRAAEPWGDDQVVARYGVAAQRAQVGAIVASLR